MTARLHIPDILKARLLTVEGVEGNLAQANFPFDPVGKSMWCAESFATVDSRPSSVGSHGIMEDVGIYTIHVYVSATQGTSEARRVTTEICAAFPMGAQLAHLDTVVTVSKSYADEGLTVGSWWVTPVTVDWSCHMKIN